MRTRLVDKKSGGSLAEANVKRTGSNAALVGANGELNANSKRDLADAVADLLLKAANKEVVASPRANDPVYVEQCSQLVSAAMEDRTHEAAGGFWRMGETISDSVWETTGRLGWTTKFLCRSDVEPGQEGRIRVKQMNVVSWIITKESYIPRSVIRQTWVYPDICTIAGWTTIDDTERAMAPVELMDEKYSEMLSATMVREDNLVRWLFTQAAPVYNDVYTFSELTPSLFSTMQLQIQRWGLNCPHAIIAQDLWNDIRTNSDFLNAYEPVSKLTILEEGRIAKLYDTEIYTDGLVYEPLQVLSSGELFFLAEPQGLGGFCEYSPLQTRPADMHHIGIGAEGWYSHMSRGYAVANSRGVCWGYRS